MSLRGLLETPDKRCHEGATRLPKNASCSSCHNQPGETKRTGAKQRGQVLDPSRTRPLCFLPGTCQEFYLRGKGQASLPAGCPRDCKAVGSQESVGASKHRTNAILRVSGLAAQARRAERYAVRIRLPVLHAGLLRAHPGRARCEEDEAFSHFPAIARALTENSPVRVPRRIGCGGARRRSGGR